MGDALGQGLSPAAIGKEPCYTLAAFVEKKSLVCGCSTGAERSACPPEVAGLNPSWFSVLLIIYLRILKQAEKG